MTKCSLLAGAAVAIVACVAVPFVGWAVDVSDEDAVKQAFLDHSGSGADADDVCVQTDAGFPQVAVVGTFAHDRGCATEVVYVDGDWLHPTAASSAALEMAGWQDADDEERARLALSWTEFGAFTFSSPVTVANDDFALPDAPAFAPPQAVPDANAGVVVTLWVQEPSGMLPRTDYNLWELTFDRDGKTVRIRVLEDYSVDY